MVLISTMLLFFLTFCSFTTYGRLLEGGFNVCTVIYYEREHYHVQCGQWWWKPCSRYKSVTKYSLKCCAGYSNNIKESTCRYAICAGKTNATNACNIDYLNDSIVYRPGDRVQRSSGGGCVSPGKCGDCHDGFYADGPYCRICPKIDNCNERRCTSAANATCVYCMGEIKSKQYWRAYAPVLNNSRVTCQKACSWRTDSRRCFPGYCKDELASKCNCSKGFSGRHCEQIDVNVSVLYAEAKLEDERHQIITISQNTSDVGPQPIIWTNNVEWTKANIQFNSKYIVLEPNLPIPNQNDHFVIDFKHGIIESKMELEHPEGKHKMRYICDENTKTPRDEDYCKIKDGRYVDISKWHFGHNHSLIFTWIVSNGGYVVYEDRDKEPGYRKRTAYLLGRRTNMSYVFKWDLIKPYHPCSFAYPLCNIPPIFTTDVTEKSTVSVTWNGWKDDLSGIHHYDIEVFELSFRGSGLATDTQKEAEVNNVPANINQTSFTLSKPGMYSVTLTVYDKALNYKVTRCLVFYDDQSKIEHVTGKKTFVMQASEETNKTWIIVPDRILTVKWNDRFLNKRHKQYQWLAAIQKIKNVSFQYDDYYGKRTINKIPNVHGVVRFEIQYKVLAPNIATQQPFTTTSDVESQQGSINVIWNDGNRLDITVKAVDIFERHIEDTITVYKDTSPPRIDYLWLSNGNHVNISVHSVEDFSKMTIEWDAFDYDSGLNQIDWRLFDNYTSNVVLHGKAELHAQGMAENLNVCEAKYKDEPRGPSCYCTMFHGCYHKHFYVEPKMADVGKHAGLVAGKDKGVHDSDYYFEVTVINNAFIKTTTVKKITIDVSPPHEGSVHDGIKGQPEVDYQQDLHLDAHWEGFFDRESGVEYYIYLFSDHCYTNDEFKNSTQTTTTYETFASYDALSEGIYHVSVVAVNRANENSNVVCSDGVRVITSIPYVKDVVIGGARTRPRLIESNGKVWLLDEKLKRHLIVNSTVSCSLSSLNLSGVFPTSSIISAVDDSWCDVPTLSILGVISKSSQLKLSWKPALSDDLIYDYEVGLSSTNSGVAPDIFPFKSSTHHNHFRINHSDVPGGKEFYIIIKTISKSGVEGIQSIGSFIVDTSQPLFTGKQIDVKYESQFLVTNWSLDAFQDPEDPYQMKFEYAIGSHPYIYDIKAFDELQFGSICKRTVPASCTAVSIHDLKWSLHGHHNYYFTIKATNLAGLSTLQTSIKYTHDIQLPSKGLVFDVRQSFKTSDRNSDIEDIDFTDDRRTMSFTWSRFVHPHQNVSFKACIGTSPKSCNVVPMATLYSNCFHTFSSLILVPFKTYYATVEAATTAGSILVSSDGITVLDLHKNLTGIHVLDGTNCSERHVLLSSHHEQDTRPKCDEDIDFQSSTSSLNSYWTIPERSASFIREAFYKIEEQIVGGFWRNFYDYKYVGNHQYTTINNLDLEPGKTYRMVLKFCSEGFCFPPEYSNGVTVLVNSPVVGTVSIGIGNATNQLFVTFDKMHDPDMSDAVRAMDVVNLYEWAIGDDIGLHTQWNVVSNYTEITNKQIQFFVPLNGTINFSKCRKLYIRGYNQAGIWATTSTELKQCTVKEGLSLISPNIVLDAVGEQEYSLDGIIRDGIGKDIFLEENENWKKTDVDYTPYKNVLSATWPTLRHKNFTWAVIDAENLDVTTYYNDDDKLELTDPCSHPDAIKCGHTTRAHMNAFFDSKNALVHGKRYLICLNAPRKEIEYEKWTEVLPEVKSCSDGVTVDLTPPKPGRVWIGIDPNKQFQSSLSEIFISWDSFTDVEEFGLAVHNSGIREYMIGIGSTKGGTDKAQFTSVGQVNHYTVHGLRLQDGHEYYATVKGIDFAGRSSTADSYPIKIDSTPPEISTKPITIEGRHLSNMNEIDACWRDVFLDTESGIDHYLWAVGAQPGHDNIIPFTETTLDCGISAEDKVVHIQEGHAYYITVKAVNKANLISTASSWAYIYDMSPPVRGHVYDGSPGKVPSYTKDIDYQTDTKTLLSYWEGFHDPHSTIKAFYVSIGTCPNCEDFLKNQAIGISKNFTLCHLHLAPGIRYYTTITACNTADMCTSVTSDGVVIDNSPPTQGIILDGVDIFDDEYQSSRNYISARWYGFTDPHSGLDHFTWRAGTRPGMDDIIKSTHLPMTDIMVEPDLKQNLPTGKRIYVTIKAYNKAGLSTEATSNGFFVDTTPPKINVKPHLSTDLGSIKDNSLVFRNTIRVKWEVEDPESYIQRQFLSISSHKGGHFNSSSTEINGIVREYTFSRFDLHDGGHYTVKLIVCNGAKICVEAESKKIIVDSSAPTPGMFAIKTDHAANLHRHVEGWMTWSRYKLWLSWLGFKDLHTDIDKYYVSVGSRYMTDDLNKVAGSPQEFLHNQSGIDKQDEGFVQTFEVDVKNLIKFEYVFVSVWAVNQVGLPGRMIHSQFKLVPGGSLELIRRCSAVTCKGHCVCAAQGQRCPINRNKCHDISKANPNNLVGVYDITDVHSTSPFTDVKYTSSNVALAAKWHIVQAQGLKPLWYEWSAGLTKSTTIDGIFADADDVWHHAGQTNQAILHLKRGRVLKEPGVSYSMIVRAWYSEDTYADFKTDGVCVLSTPLSRRKIKGSAVVEQIPGHWKKDVDFIKPGAPFTIRWTNVFLDNTNIIDRFKVYLSTYPGGHDIHSVDLDLPGTITSHNISRVPLTPGIVFYSNVVGYSRSGIHATESSDGIMVESLPPVAGIVYDGIGIHDKDYQNSSNVMSASWNGFSDRDSGISHYMWCVQTKSAKDTKCDVRDWENVGIHRAVSRILNGSSLIIGNEHESLVYAVDVIGQTSKTVKSNGVLIDTTDPEPTFMEHLDHNIASNPSFEDCDSVPTDWKNIKNVSLCNGAHSESWNVSTGSCVSVMKSGKNIAMDGRAFIFVKGSISQYLFNLKVNQFYKVSFVTAHPAQLGAVLANKEGYVEIGKERHVFLVYSKHDKHSTSSNDVDWQYHTFYFRSYRPEVIISLGSMTGNTGILFDDLKVQETVMHDYDEDNSKSKHVHAHVVSLHQWSSIHASWSFMDPESPIVDYMWAIGYTEGSTEVQGFKSVGLSTFAYNYNVTLAHTSIIHITVVATNAAGLRREAHAEDLLIDLTPPEIAVINDGIGSDIAAQTSEEISANWDVKDAESGLEHCEWAVGYQPYGNEIQTFQKLPKNINIISKVFPRSKLSMQMIHVTVRCRNNAGLQSSLSTNGVKISNLPPNTAYAEVEIVPRSLTEYNARGHYQGQTSSVRLKWTGFHDVTGMDSYMLTFESQDLSTLLTTSLTAEEQDTSFCIIRGLDMTRGNYTTSVKAVNKMYLRSIPVTDELVVSSLQPQLTDSPNLKFTAYNRTLTASWNDHFQATGPIYYEVSAGTTPGSADIIQWQETKQTFLEFTLPPKIKSVQHITAYVVVRGVSANGMTTILSTAIKLS